MSPTAGVVKMMAFRFSAIAICVTFAVVCVFALSQYPRRTLLSEVRKHNKIVVSWQVHDEDGQRRVCAFELTAAIRASFIELLAEHIQLDYLRGEATAVTTLGICLLDDDDKVVKYYTIRRGRGSGQCPQMESLREIASEVRRLSPMETAAIFNSDLHAQWPHALPWPMFRFDYILPVTQQERQKESEKGKASEASLGSFSLTSLSVEIDSELSAGTAVF